MHMNVAYRVTVVSPWIEEVCETEEQYHRYLGLTDLQDESIPHIMLFPENCVLPLLAEGRSVEEALKIHRNVLRGWVQSQGVHVIIGSLELTENGIVNCAEHWQPDGTMQIVARKYVLTDEEKVMGICTALPNVRPFMIEGITVVVAICADAFALWRETKPEAEVDLFLQPRANPQAWLAPARGSGSWQP